MPLPKEDAWFPTKKYGYGWGLPQKKEGWILLISYLVLMATSQVISLNHVWLFASTLILTLLFVLMVYLKGEKPRWRWGDSD